MQFLSLDLKGYAVKGVQSSREAAFFGLLGGAGLRVSEVAALKVEHLDGAGGYLHVVDGKAEISPKPVLEALHSHLRGRNEGYVFQGRDNGHISTRQIQRLSDTVAERAGLQETRQSEVRRRKRITPHLPRHSFSRWSLDAGINIIYLEQQLGHSSLTTTTIFLRVRPNHRRAAYERADFDKLLKPD